MLMTRILKLVWSWLLVNAGSHWCDQTPTNGYPFGKGRGKDHAQTNFDTGLFFLRIGNLSEGTELLPRGATRIQT